MIVAHMATYPSRRSTVIESVATLANQVDKICLILNEYAEVPAELKNIANLEPIIPDRDLKDTGKFYPQVGIDDHIFLADDDLLYSDGYVAQTLDRASECNISRAAFGYHGSLFRSGFAQASFRRRRVIKFHRRLDSSVIVDMLGTGTVYIRGIDMPPFTVMASAQRFTDVRFAVWCHQQGLPRVCLSRNGGVIRGMETKESIFSTFTADLPDAVLSEVALFAGKSPGLGMSPAEFAESPSFRE